MIALLGTTQPRKIELHIRRAHKKYGTSLKSGEMKADASRDDTIKRLLHAIAEEPVEIIAVIVDKEAIARPPKDAEEIYLEAVSIAISHAVKRWPRVEIFLDKRYTSKRLRYKLEKEIRERIADIPQQVVLIRQEDSIGRKELQAVDFVAWAFFQKYERGNSQYCEIIAEKIIVEELNERRLW